MQSYAAISNVGVQPFVHNMAAFLHGYTKIVSDDESKRLYILRKTVSGW